MNHWNWTFCISSTLRSAHGVPQRSKFLFCNQTNPWSSHFNVYTTSSQRYGRCIFDRCNNVVCVHAGNWLQKPGFTLILSNKIESVIYNGNIAEQKVNGQSYLLMKLLHSISICFKTCVHLFSNVLFLLSFLLYSLSERSKTTRQFVNKWVS